MGGGEGGAVGGNDIKTFFSIGTRIVGEKSRVSFHGKTLLHATTFLLSEPYDTNCAV